jgi:hypothetical protein
MKGAKLSILKTSNARNPLIWGYIVRKLFFVCCNFCFVTSEGQSYLGFLCCEQNTILTCAAWHVAAIDSCGCLGGMYIYVFGCNSSMYIWSVSLGHFHVLRVQCLLVQRVGPFDQVGFSKLPMAFIKTRGFREDHTLQFCNICQPQLSWTPKNWVGLATP